VIQTEYSLSGFGKVTIMLSVPSQSHNLYKECGWRLEQAAQLVIPILKWVFELCEDGRHMLSRWRFVTSIAEHRENLLTQLDKIAEGFSKCVSGYLVVLLLLHQHQEGLLLARVLIGAPVQWKLMARQQYPFALDPQQRHEHRYWRHQRQQRQQRQQQGQQRRRQHHHHHRQQRRRRRQRRQTSDKPLEDGRQHR